MLSGKIDTKGDVMIQGPLAEKAETNDIITSDQESSHHLISALEACARSDIYWSNEFFYRWLSAPRKKWTIFPLRPTDTPVRMNEGEVAVRVQRNAPERSGELQRLAADARFPGAAMAMARWLGKAGQYAEGLSVAQRALAGIADSKEAWDFHILHNQITAFERHLAGKRVHRALLRYLGDDDGYMLSRTCEFPSTASIFRKMATRRYTARSGCRASAWAT